MIQYKFFIDPSSNPKKVNDIELFDLSIVLTLNKEARIIGGSILSSQSILDNHLKFKFYIIKNKIISLQEILGLQLKSLDTYISNLIIETWEDLNLNYTDKQILDILVEKLKPLTRDPIDRYERLDDLLIQAYEHLDTKPNNYSFDDKYMLAMLMRTIFMYQKEHLEFIGFHNYKDHIESMKAFAKKQFVREEVCNKLFDVLLEDMLDSYQV